jgi:ribosome biogenesis GTPase / thiamine phosphate phosphatase
MILCQNRSMKLPELGLEHYLTQTKLKVIPKQLARVVAENKTDFTLINSDGEIRGLVMTTFRSKRQASELPKVGDFVEYQLIPKENKAKIIAVLPRYSTLSRLLPNKPEAQILACNVDTLIVVSGLDQDFQLEQLRRYVTMAASASIDAALVINKTDLGAGAAGLEIKIKQLFPKLKIVHTSAKTKIGLGALAKLMRRGRTVVLIGSSGAGKSSLINSLSEATTQSTKAVRTDGKGRHTTTRREMFLLPNGAIVIDTPGIRTLEIDVESAAVPMDTLFLNLAQHCRFRDCDHHKSAGCAVIAAVKTGDISEKQYQNFLKQLRDAERSETSRSIYGRKNSKAKLKIQTKALRQAYKTRKPPKK